MLEIQNNEAMFPIAWTGHIVSTPKVCRIPAQGNALGEGASKMTLRPARALLGASSALAGRVWCLGALFSRALPWADVLTRFQRDFRSRVRLDSAKITSHKTLVQ